MLHVFNGPVEPVSLAEFQKAKGKKTLFTCHTKRKINYHEDGRRFVDDKIENELSVSNLWSTVLTRSVAQDLKDQSNEELNLRDQGLIRCGNAFFVATACATSQRTDYIRFDTCEYYTYLAFFLRFCILILYDGVVFSRRNSPCFVLVIPSMGEYVFLSVVVRQTGPRYIRLLLILSMEMKKYHVYGRGTCLRILQFFLDITDYFLNVAVTHYHSRMLTRTFIRSSRLISLADGKIQAIRGVRASTKVRFSAYERVRGALLGSAAIGTTGVALIPFLGKKSDKGASEEISRLERFKQEADTLYSVYLIENAYNVLRRFSSGSDPQMLWRLARVLCEKAKMSKDKDDKKRFMYDALKMAEKAIDNEGEESCWEAHKWYAIVLSYVLEYEGTKEQIRQSFEVRKHLEKALDVNSSDATTWHALGVWYFTYADLSSWKAVIVRALFGSIPPATYDDALRCFQKAEFIKPNCDSSNLWYLAEVKTRLGQKEEALELYKAAFKMPVITMDDGDTHDKAYEKLRKLGIKDFTKL
ncbi:unnamed protein product [Litomosoides sigmodontis]|uniref:Regulator of microtubule dynamics protein 1 n=1 Tax=Litomosoides sigmodontis TaxID=42156 RepID=A0A3P6TZ72_LITSI|nr:unnamed protein product [Litomosoides sigmodontis]